MPQDIRIALFLLAQLVAALQANDPDLFKRWLYCAMQDPREPAVTELLLDGFPRSSSELSWTEWWRGTWA